ncbi:GntR family transcriptional regulator [Pseudonocardia sp. WMMC193]|uniref:GntR family transcriptional regulator n=1 Tax=Pseudonocardia sp. WMMC193 TaxID=2911965 RepID=UPI001F47B235|nr:GntR family transcriptional regulator [Pseudonocardia sp. WMMC193]MCF7549334.1 GntR family transcriptional regulator [Pseudonocardia sp. WMMC193]
MAVGQESSLVKSGAAVDRVVGEVLAQIAAGELGPGEQLRQEELARTLGTSRVPVREALHALAEQGVLAHQKHRGFFVTKRSPGELAQLARMLELLEDEVVGEIVWPDAQVIEHIRGLNERLLAIVDDVDPAETFAVNREFHFAIFVLSPQSVIVEELDRLWRLAQPYIIAEMLMADARRQRYEEHLDIVAALEVRDREALIAAMRQHRRRSRGEQYESRWHRRAGR